MQVRAVKAALKATVKATLTVLRCETKTVPSLLVHARSLEKRASVSHGCVPPHTTPSTFVITGVIKQEVFCYILLRFMSSSLHPACLICSRLA